MYSRAGTRENAVPVKSGNGVPGNVAYVSYQPALVLESSRKYFELWALSGFQLVCRLLGL